ncbi:MAG TPA: CBS domain-containing protein [Propionibacteriaceae bacterium]
MRAINGVRRSGVAVEPHRPIRDAAMIMDQAGVGSLAVIDDGRLVGIVTDRDLVRRGLARDLAPTAPVEKVMSTPVVTIGAEADLHSAFKLFRTHAVRRLAVVDFDDFVGMITVDDLLVDVAADLLDLARPIAAEVFRPRDPADASRRIEGDAMTRVTDQTKAEPSDPVRLFVSDNLISIEPDATLHQVAHRLAAEGVGALVVTDGDRVVGIISERDVVGAAASGKDLDATTAAEQGTSRVVRCTPDTSIRRAAQLMMEQYVRHLLVVDRNGPIGMVSARDLLGAYAS